MPKKIERKTLTLSTIAKRFSDEEEAYKYVEKIRWANGVVCPHCGSIDKAYFLEPQNGERATSTGKKTYRRVWKCGECREQFSVLVGTAFEDSKIPLSKWLLAMQEMCSAKNGASSHELARKLGITQKSAWFMAHRIRFAMARPPFSTKLQGVIEADETYIGGRAHGKRGRGAANKTPVVSLVQRGGDVRSQTMPQVSSKNIRQVLKKNIESSATLMTDTLPVYVNAGRDFAKHETVDHSKGEYVRGKTHVNTTEGYFSQLKRSLDGTFHHVSEKHLDRYLAEFDYRYNTRKEEDGTRMEEALRKSAGKRLTYREPIGKEAESLT